MEIRALGGGDAMLGGCEEVANVENNKGMEQKPDPVRWTWIWNRL